MLKEHSLIYFSPEKWDGLWRNRQQLMSIFSRQNKVLFVEPRLYLRSMPGDRATWRGIDGYRSSVRQVSENLFVFSYPIYAPISERFPLKQFTKAVRSFYIHRTLQKLQMSHPIVWFSRPEMVDLMDEIPPAQLLLYHVVDEYTAYSRQSTEMRQRLQRREQEMMAIVDAIVVVSENLFAAKNPFNLNTYLIPNGVNYRAYSEALASSYLPSELKAIKCPRLGYIGLIGDKLDFKLLKELAEKNPNWSLVFVGETRVTEQAECWQALQALSNVHYLGAVHVSLVPYYVKGFQVGLMPYRQGRHAENISPLKLYDYLAAGLPVASLDFPSAREFKQYVQLADSPQNFDKSVQAALADISPERSLARRSIAAQHTWEARVEQLSALIERLLNVKASNNGRQEVNIQV